MSGRYLTYSFLNLLLVLLPVACQENTQQNVLEPNLVVQIYTQTILSALDSTRKDTDDHLMRVLDSLNIEESQFDTTLARYEQDPEIWLDILAEVNKILEEKQNANTPSPDTLKK